MKRRYISVDVDKCMGCHTCELACAMAHGSTDDLSALIRSGEKPGYRIYVESYQATSIPVPCNHCEEAACILACPTGACHRESEGAPVLVDNDKCIGCRMCVQACPFGMISVHPLGSGVVKCDLCILRLAQGEDPACVSSCPTKALSFAEEEEVNRSKRLKVAERMAAAKETEEAEHEDYRMTTVTVCVGSSCHIKGARDMIERFNKLVKAHQLEKQVELKGSFCMERCGEGVNWQIGDTFYSSSSVEEAVKIFEEEVIQPNLDNQKKGDKKQE